MSQRLDRGRLARRVKLLLWNDNGAKKARGGQECTNGDRSRSQEAVKSARRSSRAKKKVVAFFPEAAFGPALNSVGIAQAVEKLGHKAVFLSDPGFLEVYRGYGFEAHPVNLSEPMPAEEMARFWTDFINGHIPNFRKVPYDQIDNYVKDCWQMIVSTAKWAEKDLPGCWRRSSRTSSASTM